VVAADGTLLRVNRAFERLELADGRSHLTFPELRRLVTAGRGTLRLSRPTPAGVQHLAATLVTVDDADGSRVLSVQDITQIHRDEEEDGRRRRLEALGRMAAELAHEVRNPLGSMRLDAALLRDDVADQPEQCRMAERILAAVSGLEATVANLLAFAQPARGARRAVDLTALARESCALVAATCAVRHVRLEAPPDECSLTVEAEPEGLRQILLNLLGNALSATAPGGTIRVGVETEEGWARLEVADDGRGIAAEDLPRVFDPFFSRTDGGTGLGLSIVHGIVERHGGRIRLVSALGSGTTARVEIPIGTLTSAPVEHPHA
jgi:two-component system sensor histidine kinase PilS (NtrC family)